MKFLPISIKIEGKKIVVIGGGNVAAQKLRTLIKFNANIFVYAKVINDEIRAMPLKWIETKYDISQIENAFLIYACTDDKTINHLIAKNACERGILINVADDPEQCEFTSPAIWFHELMSVAVSSDATNAKKSVAWRNAIKDWGENDLIHW